MLIPEDQSKLNDAAQPVPELKMEGPLAEKDQQGLAADRARKLGEKALVQWQNFEQKIVNQFKK